MQNTATNFTFKLNNPMESEKGSSETMECGDESVEKQGPSAKEEQDEAFRRKSHNSSDKRRRDKINACIGQLGELVPSAISLGKPDKSTVLQLAVSYLKELRNENEELKTTIHSLINKHEPRRLSESDIYRDRSHAGRFQPFPEENDIYGPRRSLPVYPYSQGAPISGEMGPSTGHEHQNYQFHSQSPAESGRMHTVNNPGEFPSKQWGSQHQAVNYSLDRASQMYGYNEATGKQEQQ
eukprot:Nk52_evm1s270 gene=Nk52_evmTU1s270